MPYPIVTDAQVVRALHRKLLTALDEHLLWAFNPSPELPRTGTRPDQPFVRAR